jgi:predicted  nucleic acid-binding Zn-ribbon protein
MSDEKPDLILTVVSDIKVKINELDAKANNSETKMQAETIAKRLDRLEDEIILNRTETLNHRRKIKDLEMRLTRLEEIISLTV